MKNTGHFIKGQWLEGEGKPFKSIDPGGSKILWEGRSANEKEIDQAVDAANEAFLRWSDLSQKNRLEYIMHFVEQLQEHKEALAECIAQEVGKPLWESRTEVSAMISKANISIAAQMERAGTKTQELGNLTSVLRHQAHGVIAVYGPFNFPGHLPNGHIIPALLAGNTVVFKPSELTPNVAEQMLHCWERAALPVGVLNLVQGKAETGKILASHPGINGLFFTGSSETGSKIHETFGKHPEKILALELGGNNPLVVWQPKNIDAAVYHGIQSAYITSGQRCTCARRLILPEDISGDLFLEKFIEAMKTIRVGYYNSEPTPFMGPVVSARSADELLAKQEALIQMGAKDLHKMYRLKEGGAYLNPGLIDVTGIKNLPDSEIFGPFLQVVRVKDFDDAIIEANKTAYGLSAGLFCTNERLYSKFRKRIRAGIINWNTQTTGASGKAPFGGCGLSGNHRPSAYYAADYCAYPVASMEAQMMSFPDTLTPGIGKWEKELTK